MIYNSICIIYSEINEDIKNKTSKKNIQIDSSLTAAAIMFVEKSSSSTIIISFIIKRIYYYLTETTR